MSFNFLGSVPSLKKVSRSHVFGILLASVLVGCGGGKSSTTNTSNNLPSPVSGGINGEVLVPNPVGQSPAPSSSGSSLPQVSVGQRQFADPNVLLNLRGTVKAADGAQIVKTLWTQVSGPEVIIPSPLLLENIVLSPDVDVATQLEFRLTAQDSIGRVNSATVAVLVKPVPTFVKVIGGVFNEADERAVFKIRLNAPSTSPITVSYITQDGTANSSSEDVDYVAASGEVVFAPGEVLKEVYVDLVNDVLEENDESFSLQVTALNGTTTYANTGVAIIRNGAEPQLTQEIVFAEKGPITLYVDDEYSNTLVPSVENIIYSSSDSSVASVNAEGLVTAVAAGTVVITATKPADETYLSASASYTVNVRSRGTPPTVNIYEGSEGGSVDIYSVGSEQFLYLRGAATDEEDGSLPTEAQLSEYYETEQPIKTLSWSSSIDGFLAHGEYLQTDSLSIGTHVITYSVVDSDGNTGSASVRVHVGNIAPLAYADASSTYCPDETVGLHCYSPFRTNDESVSTELGGFSSWVNDNQDTTKLPQSVELYWEVPVTVSSIDLYTTEGYILRDYDIEYVDGESWVPLISIENNTEVYRSHAVPTVTTYQIRVVAKEGSLLQPQHARINEILVFGTVPDYQAVR